MSEPGWSKWKFEYHCFGRLRWGQIAIGITWQWFSSYRGIAVWLGPLMMEWHSTNPTVLRTAIAEAEADDAEQ